ncbi:hypothetical protein PPERSA_02994 [Pseudocohnilembus persalinus]|uniref:MaoC-like domain-containing protein n=1 Tax=Pseudocohnilembus persalinus TaxID=266149 RepID=A0A0V0QEU6_PSEPJ|nr:hypothetical protein PPERSA_02994 [Pseudocohnilembus persalinus]|eukprot:KRX00734.1 hypothetical protein PPERSA_02994 [Pseudocohnilembus persalinus]
MQKTQKFEQIQQKGIFNKEDFDYYTLLSTQIPPSIDKLTSENCILFALGIGYSKDPIAEKEDLKYTYELHDNFSIFPMHGFNLLKDKNPFEYLLYAKGKPIPHPMCLVHGEERCEIYKQFQTEQKYYTETKIIDAEDKISGLLMTHCSSTFEYNNGKKGDLVFKSINSWFLRGLGGSQFKGTGQRIKMPQIPKKNPIFEITIQIDKNQHALYRLAGDKNPLHIDNREAQKLQQQIQFKNLNYCANFINQQGWFQYANIAWNVFLQYRNQKCFKAFLQWRPQFIKGVNMSSIGKKQKYKPEDFDLEKAFNYKFEPHESSFSVDDAILYAISIGLSRDPVYNKEDLKYTYENDSDYSVFPIGGLLLFKGWDIQKALMQNPGIPPIHPMAILHGEQRCEFYLPFKPNQKYLTYLKITDFVDKGSGLLYQYELQTYEKSNEKKLAGKFISTLFVRGHGGSQYKGKGNAKQIPPIPKREHDMLVEEKIAKNQAILYRLTGDKNPLHIDFQQAAAGGFNQPILHGMNFYALGAKNIVKRFLHNQEDKLKVYQCRFVGYVFPGETIIFKYWKEGNQIFLQGEVLERKSVCLQGYAEVQNPPQL